MQLNLYQPKSGIVVVTITLEFLVDKYIIALHNCHTHDSITTKTSTLLQSLYLLLNAIQIRTSSEPYLYEPKSGLVLV
jgi:hypothetical protein